MNSMWWKGVACDDTKNWKTSPRLQLKGSQRKICEVIRIPRQERGPGILPAGLDAGLNEPDPFVRKPAGPVRRDGDPGAGSER